MKKYKKIFALLVALVMVLSFTACGGGDTGGGGDVAGGDEGKVGISMPTMDLQRWNQDGNNMKSAFEAAGFTVDLQYAQNDVPMQINQIENMIAAGVDVLVIAAIDGGSLTEVLAEAQRNDIAVIAYDRLIMGTDAVSYYVTFDNWKVGTLQGTFLEDALDLPNADDHFYIEFFTGDPGDNNIHFFFGGAMEVLRPYLDSGTLVCLSGQTETAQVATIAWDPANAQSRMENLIATHNYSPTGQRLDAVMCSNDSTAQGVTTALQGAGFTAENFPLVTGQDCDIVSVRNMIAGYQAMSVFKDTRTLAAQTVTMVTAILNGNTVPINNTSDYDNGTGIIPTFLCDPVFADINNFEELLIDSGYYTRSELGL